MRVTITVLSDGENALYKVTRLLDGSRSETALCSSREQAVAQFCEWLSSRAPEAT